jgi:hypothetical protein
MQPSREPFRSVRTEQLRRLDMCERGLAAALRRAGWREPAEASERLAAELRERLVVLGGTPDPDVDETWLVGSLADAAHAALATYHDHLGDFDSGTVALFRDRIIPHHCALMALLDGGALRESEL